MGFKTLIPSLLCRKEDEYLDFTQHNYKKLFSYQKLSARHFWSWDKASAVSCSLGSRVWGKEAPLTQGGDLGFVEPPHSWS